MVGWSVKRESKLLSRDEWAGEREEEKKKTTQETRREKGDECPVGRKERKERGK